MNEFRWKVWELASWVAWWLCPDKNALRLIMQNGSITSRMALDEAARDRVKRTKANVE